MICNGMPVVRLRHELVLVSGGSIKAGAVLFVSREYRVNRGRERRYALADSNGRVVLPCVRVEDVEEIE